MNEHASFGWMLLILGLIVAGIGLVWLLVPSIPWLGRLPGDIRIERDGALVDDSFDVVLYYPKTRAMLRASMIALAPDLRFVVRGEQGAFVKHGIDPQEEALKRGELPRDDTWGREAQEKWGILYTPKEDTVAADPFSTMPGDYRLFYANVRDAILQKAPMDVTPEQILDVMKALELAQESSRKRCTLDW